MRLVVIILSVIFFILYTKICQHLEDLDNSVDQYFLNEQCMMLQNHAWVKDLSKVQNRPMNSKVTEYEKFIDKVSDSTLQLTYKKLLYVKFCYNIKKYKKLSEKGC